MIHVGFLSACNKHSLFIRRAFHQSRTSVRRRFPSGARIFNWLVALTNSPKCTDTGVRTYI